MFPRFMLTVSNAKFWFDCGQNARKITFCRLVSVIVTLEGALELTFGRKMVQKTTVIGRTALI